MKLTKLLILLLFLSLKGFSQTTITSNVTIDQNWISAHPIGPWEISTSSVTVTFGTNLVLNDASQYFIITGSNIIIDGAGKTATISGVINYPGLVDASNTDASSLIKNIGVNTTGITSLSDYVGYISKSNNKATIRSCYSTGEISGIWAGGIAGATNSGNISNCYSTGEISGERGGGVAGNYNEGNISNCYSTGPISAYSTGGISGRNNSGNILNCYSSGAISGSLAGGIAGARHVGSITDSRSSGSRTLYIGAEDIAQSVGTGTISNSINVTPTFPNSWDKNIADIVLTDLVTVWNTSNTPYTLMSFLLSELTITTPIATLTSCLGTASSPTTFGVTGAGLTASITISAPSNFEISTSSGGTYSSSLTLTNTSTVSQTLYIRLNSSATVGSKIGTITATSTEATDVITTISGTVNSLPNIGISGTTTNPELVSLTASGGSTYVWSDGSSTSSATNTFDASGLYSLSVTDANGCISSTNLNIAVQHWGLSRNGEKTLDSAIQININGQIGSLNPITQEGKRREYKKRLSIGDIYGGGIVAYILQIGDPGYVGGEQHGLIAATSDQGSAIQWYNGSYTITGATGTAIGTGLANTNTIINSQGGTPTSYAAGLARAYTGGGYTDWYLPSIDELNKFYLNKVAIGGFANGSFYWSSTEVDISSAWGQLFNKRGSQTSYYKNDTYHVRAVRSF